MKRSLENWLLSQWADSVSSLIFFVTGTFAGFYLEDYFERTKNITIITLMVLLLLLALIIRIFAAKQQKINNRELEKLKQESEHTSRVRAAQHSAELRNIYSNIKVE